MSRCRFRHTIERGNRKNENRGLHGVDNRLAMEAVANVVNTPLSEVEIGRWVDVFNKVSLADYGQIARPHLVELVVESVTARAT